MTWRLAQARILVSMSWVVFAVACGGGDETPGSDGDNSDGSGGNMPGATGGTTGGGTGGSGTTGGAPNGTVEPPTTRPTVTCGSDTVTYKGTVGGAAVDETLTIESGPIGAFTPVAFDRGVQALYLEDGRAGGAILFPQGSQNAGQVWCIDDGLAREDAGAGYSYIGHLLGSCPGTPTGDTIYACMDSFGFECDPAGAVELRPLGGTLGGREIVVESVSLSGGGTVFVRNLGGYQLVVFGESEVQNGASGAVTGLVYARPGTAHEGEVYCIDGGTWTKNEDGSSSRFVFDNVSYLGSCLEGGPTESLEGCSGF